MASPGDLAGLADIAGWGQRLGIDVTAELQMARIMHQADPAALHAMADQHGATGTRLADGHQRLRVATIDAGQTWSGETATAVTGALGSVVDELAAGRDRAAALADTLRTAATAAEQGQRGTAMMTAATAAALRVLAASGPAPGTGTVPT